MRRRTSGVTLLELMVVVAIVSILAALSVRMFKTNPARAKAWEVAGWIQEARRRAIALGPVRSDVASTLGSKARTMVEYTPSSVYVYALVEDALPAHTGTWVLIGGVGFDPSIVVAAVGTSAALQPGGTVPDALEDEQTQKFFPDGTCEAGTAYLEHVENEANRYRVVVLPLSGQVQVYGGW